MKKYNKKNLIASIITASFVLAVLGLTLPIATFAATTPSLGTAATFGILTGTFNHDIATTTIIGVVSTNALGYTIEAGVGPLLITGNTITAGATYTAAGTAQGTALTALSAPAQPCGNGGSIPGYTFLAGIVNLATNTERGGTTGHYSPGVYCITGAMNIGTAGIVLDTPGTYIFRSTGAFDTADTSTAVTLGTGVSACDVFWIPGAATTIHANNTFVGTVIDDAGITISHLVTWTGRALAYAAGSGVVTADTTTLTVPTCSSPTLTVNKVVVRDNGGTEATSSFSLFIDGSSVDTGVASTTSTGAHIVSETYDPTTYTQTFSSNCPGGIISLASGANETCTITNNDIAPSLTLDKIVVNNNGGTKAESSWTLTATGSTTIAGLGAAGSTDVVSTSSFKIGIYTLSETGPARYTASAWSCTNSVTVTNNQITLGLGQSTVCSITNNDIALHSSSPSAPPVPPLIDVVKIPNPLALPLGPGPVTYTYTLRNIGTVPMTSVSVIDNACSPTTFISGDTNADANLDVNETWIYHCSMTLSTTTTNTVVATGWANGLSSIDIANATVVVGVPVIPPLIHVTKVPSVFALSAPGGAVTYTYTVTNPGTAPLSNVTITDDKCTGLPGRVLGHPGDLNKNDLLESNESWTFTCQSNITQTTVNTATASGDANGLTAKDIAIATVVVAPVIANVTTSTTTTITTATPKLPNTGFSSDGENTSWAIVVLSSILTFVLAILILARRKQRI